MGIKDKMMEQMTKQTAPGILKVLESLHAHLEIQAALQKEILILLLAKNTANTMEEARDAVETIIKSIAE